MGVLRVVLGAVAAVLLCCLIWPLVFPGEPTKGDSDNFPLNRLFNLFIDPEIISYDTGDFAWTALLRDNAADIRAEFEAFERVMGGDEAWKGFTDRNRLSKTGEWKNIVLFNFGVVDEFVAGHFPKTMALLLQTPLVSALFSLLPEDARIRTHFGEYRGHVRYHLTLEATDRQMEFNATPMAVRARDETDPYPLPQIVCARCAEPPNISAAHLGVLRMRPGTHRRKRENILGVETYPFVTGSDHLFDDTYSHYAVNLGPGRRLVLFCDMPRHDLPWPVWAFNMFGIYVIAPHLGFTRSYLKGQNSALHALGHETNLVPWYRHAPWLASFWPQGATKPEM